MSISLRKVAAVAGVSPSTVSRYVKGELSLTSKTAEKIDAALIESGWNKENKEIAYLKKVTLVIPELNNPFFSKLAAEILSLAESNALNISLKVSGGTALQESRLLKYLATKSNTQGIIFIGNTPLQEIFDVSVVKKPLVIVDENILDTTPSNICLITADNENGAYQATNHLIMAGHKKIAFVGGLPGTFTADARERGYREALKFHGLSFHKELIFRGPYSEAYGVSVLPKIIASSFKPSAIFATSDVAALGIIGAISNFGLKIPEDISIIGFDGIDLCDWLNPRLSSVAQPVTKMAKAAIASLLAIYMGENPEDTVLPMQLVSRSSVKLGFSE